MKTFFLDIETIPNQSLNEDNMPKFDPTNVKLGNLKDPIKISEKIKSEKDKWTEVLNKKMSIDPDLCEVVCFGYTFGTDETDRIINMSTEDSSLVENACGIISTAHTSGYILVSYNGIQFDLPVLQRRAMLLGCKGIPGSIYQLLTKRYNTNSHFDVMQELAGWQRDKWKSMDYYLKRFGIGSKGDMDGSKVYESWQAGEYDKIAEYCVSDVNNLRSLFLRIENYLY